MRDKCQDREMKAGRGREGLSGTQNADAKRCLQATEFSKSLPLALRKGEDRQLQIANRSYAPFWAQLEKAHWKEKHPQNTDRQIAIAHILESLRFMFHPETNYHS